MGTTYTVYDDGATVIEIDESSNRFAVHMQNVEIVRDIDSTPVRLCAHEGFVFTRTAMTTEALLLLGAEIMKTALYWAPDDDSITKAKEIVRNGDPAKMRFA